MVIKLTSTKKVAVMMSLILSVSSTSVIPTVQAVNINNDLTNKVTKIEDRDIKGYPFKIDEQGVLIEYYGSDKEVIIPKGVKKISFGAFMNNDQIEKVIFPEGLESILEMRCT